MRTRIGVLAFVCVLGMALGSLKFRGIGLGTAGVLFAGILVGHFGKPVDHHTLDFVKEFGLILFVFTIGLQLGPGFFAALRQQGVKMNVARRGDRHPRRRERAAHRLAGGLRPRGGARAFSPAPRRTRRRSAPARRRSARCRASRPTGSRCRRSPMPSPIPTAIVGIIGTLLLLKQIFRIDPAREAAEFAAKNRRQVEPLERRTLVVTNPNLDGVRLDAIPGRLESRRDHLPRPPRR